VPPDPDDGQLTDDKQTGSKKWVDLPLFAGQWPIGKLSCDFTAPDVDLNAETTRIAIDRFNQIANIAAPVLEMLRNHNFSAPLRHAASAVRRMTTVDQVLNFCTRKENDGDIALLSSKYFNCDNADVLFSSSDSFGRTCLVLRRTSFEPMLSEVDSAYYPLDDACLSPTAFTAMTEDSIRIDNLLNVPHLKVQLSGYREGLTWAHRIPLSMSHGSLLIVYIPIEANTGTREFAVLRLADKRDRVTGIVSPFDERDESLLEIIAKQTLGPRLLAIRHQSVSSAMKDKLATVRGIVYEDASPWKRLTEIASRAIEEDPGGRGAKKAYMISKCVDSETFEVIESGGALALNTDVRRFALRHSMTGHAVATGKLVYSWDLDLAELNGFYRPICIGAHSALICPMRYRGRVTGAMAVISSHRDLSAIKDGYILKALADEAAAVLEHHRVATYTTLLAGVKHDFHAFLFGLAAVLRSSDVDKRDMAMRYIDVLGDLADVHCCERAVEPDIFQSTAACHDICELVENMNEIVRSLNDDFRDVATKVHRQNGVLSAPVVVGAVNACLFNLLMNANEQAMRYGGHVDVIVTITLESVDIEVQNRCERSRAMIFSKGPWLELSGDKNVDRGMGVTIVRRVLSWYRFPGTEEGCLKYSSVEDESFVKFCARLRFPVPVNVDIS
jgi:hypothetical protein